MYFVSAAAFVSMAGYLPIVVDFHTLKGSVTRRGGQGAAAVRPNGLRA